MTNKTPGSVKRGRPADESRAAAIRARLVSWKQTPEPQRISLRALAVELGTSHQVLSFYLRSLHRWQKEEYEQQAEDIRNRAEAENRCLTPWEEARAVAYDRAALHSMIDSVLNESVPKILKGLEAAAKAGNLSKQQQRTVMALARNGFPQAQKIVGLICH